jgi:hypothetical protein
MGKFWLPRCALTECDCTTTYERKDPRVSVLHTNLEYPVRSFVTGLASIMPQPLRSFDMVRLASLLAATVLDLQRETFQPPQRTSKY